MLLSAITASARAFDQESFVRLYPLPALVALGPPEADPVEEFQTPAGGVKWNPNDVDLDRTAVDREEDVLVDTWFIKRSSLFPPSQGKRQAPHDPEVIFLAKAGRNPFSGMVTVGRSPNNDIVLHGGTISKVHAHFVQVGTQWRILDPSSRNGCFLDGVRVPPAGLVLKSGAEIVFARLAFHFYEAGALHTALGGRDRDAHP